MEFKKRSEVSKATWMAIAVGAGVAIVAPLLTMLYGFVKGLFAKRAA